MDTYQGGNSLQLQAQRNDGEFASEIANTPIPQDARTFNSEEPNLTEDIADQPFDEMSDGSSDAHFGRLVNEPADNEYADDDHGPTYTESRYGASIDELLANHDFVKWFGTLDMDDPEYRDMPDWDREILDDALYSLENPYECVCGVLDPLQTMWLRLQCGCARCTECLNNNVRVGLESHAAFPPRCCGTAIDIDEISYLLDEDVLDRWHKVRGDFTDTKPTYCAIPSCSKYIARGDDRLWATCECGAWVCLDCHHLFDEHEYGLCPPRLTMEDQKLVDEQKWQTCKGCGNIVERADGCDHMICTCGFEFCYTCGKEYKGELPCNCTGQRAWVGDGEGNQAVPAMPRRDDAAGWIYAGW